MKEGLKRTVLSIRKLFGFEKNSPYVTHYLNEANIRSTVYMAFITIALEIWMIIRSFHKYVIPKTSAAGGGFATFFQNVFKYTSYYWLLIIAALAILGFSANYLREKKKPSKVTFIFSLVTSGLCLAYTPLIFIESALKNPKSTVINNATIVAIYAALFSLGVTILAYSFYHWKKKKQSDALSVLVIVMFAVMCLSFGIKVSYSDFFSTSNQKMIICFLMMVIYVGCLLIWKPYASILMLGGIFAGFYAMLDYFPDKRVFLDGDKVNYITFLVSLVTVCVSIYHQRLREATKDFKLEKLAREDDLTGVENYRYFVQRVRSILEESETVLSEKIYLFMNIVNFKTYNDQYGFEEGNKYLCEMADKLTEVFAGDPVARQEDDHFIIFTDAETFEKKLLLVKDWIDESKQNIYLDIKFGGFRPASRDEDPRKSLDCARYAAGTIKNRYDKLFLEYDAKMDIGYHKRQYVINNIDKAIENGYIKAYYQPVIWSKNGELCGCEALARWIDPVYGFLSPGDFIPILEECRQINKLDRAIFEIVCKDLRAAMDAGRPCVPVSLNFSRLDFELMDAVGVLEELVEQYQIPKEMLHVEVTESALTENANLLQNAVHRLHECGYAIWLDDFGSGYSSLNVLKDYNFDLLKIDMKFLTNFEEKPKTKDILLSIVSLADAIGMKTLTEGVETTLQADYLKEIGCGRLQGYLYGKPLPLETLREEIQNGTYRVSETII